jgi:hypothetical protein
VLRQCITTGRWGAFWVANEKGRAFRFGESDASDGRPAKRIGRLPPTDYSVSPPTSCALPAAESRQVTLQVTARLRTIERMPSFGPIIRNREYLPQRIEIKRIVKALGKWGRFVYLRALYMQKRGVKCGWNCNHHDTRRRWMSAYQQVIREVQEEESWNPTVGNTCRK